MTASKRLLMAFIAALAIVPFGYARAGDWTTRYITPPGATFTLATGINKSGWVTGAFQTSDQTIAYHGFIDVSGVVQVFDVPGVGQGGTIPCCISADGAVAGVFSDTQIHGFRRDSAGRVTVIDPPGSIFTYVTAMNNAGYVVGWYQDVAGKEHGFVYKSGKFGVIDATDAIYTSPSGINEWGLVVGNFTDAGGGFHGFRYQSGILSPIDIAGAVATFVNGVDRLGEIAGAAQIGPGTRSQGFILRGGVFEAIEPFDASSSEVVAAAPVGRAAGNYLGDDGLMVNTGFFHATDGAIDVFPSGAILRNLNESDQVIGDFGNGLAFIATRGEPSSALARAR